LAFHFSDYSFLVHHPVNRDDRHLLAHAMASEFTVTWQFSQREQLFVFVTDQTSRSYLMALWKTKSTSDPPFMALVST
jgi:hypothetical protein